MKTKKLCKWKKIDNSLRCSKNKKTKKATRNSRTNRKNQVRVFASKKSYKSNPSVRKPPSVKNSVKLTK